MFWTLLNVTVTCWFVLIVNVQLELLPLQPPVHPVKDEFAAAVAVSVTWVPLAKLATQVGEQLIPDVLLAIVPEPVPDSLTVSAAEFWMVLKLAVTC
jgi:hypothetical protein